MSEATDKFTQMQRDFIAHYVDCLNATEAARRAKYKYPNKQGPRMLVHVGIRTEIDRQLAERTMSKNEVIARLNALARSDMTDFLRVDEEEVTLTWSLVQPKPRPDGTVDIAGVALDLAMSERVKPTDLVLATVTAKRATARLDLMEAGRNGKLGLIKKYQIDKDGKVVIELYDAQAALVKLGEAYGVFRDRIADNLDAIAAAAQSLDAKLADLTAGSTPGGAPAESDASGEGGTVS